MTKRFYVKELKRAYEIDLDDKSFKRRIEKFFDVKKESNKNCFWAEELQVKEVMDDIVKEIHLKRISSPIEKFELLVESLSEFEKNKLELCKHII